MESSSRMRRCLRRNYRGSDHCGAAANCEDQIDLNKNRQNALSSSNTSILAADAIAIEAVNDDDEQTENDSLDGRADDTEQSDVNHSKLTETCDQNLQASAESSDTQLVNDQELIQGSSPVAPGYVPSELDERIILELPSTMVRPLRVIQGTFQVSSVVLAMSIFFNHDGLNISIQ